MFLFIESWEFTEWITGLLDDSAFAEVQRTLWKYPESGVAIPGCGGLRKLRIADPTRQQGKRGGARLLYLYIPDAERIYLVAGFDKGEKIDLSPAEKRPCKSW